jgi:hypothetical protein
MDRLSSLGDALVAFEEARNRATGGDGHLEELQSGIPFERVADGLLSRHAAQAFRGLLAIGEHLLHHQRRYWQRRVLARTGVALQDLLQRHACGSFFSKAFEPFFHPFL